MAKKNTEKKDKRQMKEKTKAKKGQGLKHTGQNKKVKADSRISENQAVKKLWKKIAAGCVAGGLLVGFAVGSVAGFYWNTYKTKVDKEKQIEKEKSGKYYKVAKEVKLGKYKGLQISLVPTEEDRQDEINSKLQEYTTYQQLKGTAKNGDLVYGEFEGSIGGVKMDELCGSDYIDIGSKEWLEDFEKAFIGMKTGKSKKVSVKVPEGTYGDENIDGKTVQFKLTLRYICGDAIVPEYNDEFVQSISDYQSVAEYDEYLNGELEKAAEEQKTEYAWSKVLENAEINNYPDDMVAAAKEEVIQGYYDMADLQGLSHDEIYQSFGYADEQDFIDTQLDALARDTVKEIMVAQAIANKEGISYTEKEYRTLLKDEYENNKSSYDSEEDYEKNNENYLKNTALIDKVKSWIDKKTDYERSGKK